MSDRPFTELLDKLERGEALSDLECKLLVLEGRSYVRMLTIEADLFNAASEERDEAWEILASLKDERTLRDERDVARLEAQRFRESIEYMAQFVEVDCRGSAWVKEAPFMTKMLFWKALGAAVSLAKDK